MGRNLKALLKGIAIFMVVLISNRANACSCFVTPLDSAQILKTPYIALVKVTRIIDSTFKKDNFPSFQVEISEIKRFKGSKQEKLLVNGSASKFRHIVSTSCDIGLEEGQEWLVFANIGPGGKMMIGACTHTAMYRAADGLRGWLAHGGLRSLDYLNNYYKKNQAFTVATINGIKFLRYQNRVTEQSITYKNGKKNGVCFTYYPNGKPYGVQNYRKDSLDGPSTWYYPDGKVYRRDNYKMGKTIDTSYYYAENGNPYLVTIKSKLGQVVKSSHFHYGSTVLESETFFKNNKSSHTIYYRTDATRRTVHYHTENGEAEEEYNSQGELTRTRYWNKLGKIIKENTLPYAGSISNN